MSRSEGLVQRRIVSSSGQSNEKTNNSNNVNDLSNYDGETSHSKDDHDIDSKETRLTLMEEVLLLGLKDKEVFRLVLIVLLLIDIYLIIRVIHLSGTTAYQQDLEVVF